MLYMWCELISRNSLDNIQPFSVCGRSDVMTNEILDQCSNVDQSYIFYGQMRTCIWFKVGNA